MMTKLFLICSLYFFCVFGGLVNKKVAREIDISSNIARVTSTITLQNDGSGAANEFYFALPAGNSTRLSAAFATQGDDDSLSVTEDASAKLSGAPAGATFYKVKLQTAIAAGEDTEVEIELVFTGAINPFPRTITQKDNQLVIFYDNLHFFSPYPTTEESVSVTLASSTVEGNYPKEDAEVSESTIKYKDFENVAAYSFELLMVHYQNNKPFVVAENLHRTVQVSHWGALQIEEAYKLVHTGAKLTGPFSRLDMMRFGAPSSVADVSAVLPAAASEIYFRDVIGNISSSEIKAGKGSGSEDDVDEDKIEVKMTQRFPLFGGWQTEFYYGYNLALENNMNITDSGKYQLTFPFASPLKEMVTQEMTIDIILPEGASDVTINVAGAAAKFLQSTTLSNLDTAGRPTFTLTASNIVSPDNDDVVVVEYNFSSGSLYQEPILLTVGFFCIFVTSMVVNWMFFQ